jgi:nicotinate-nucleotide adenylyltransferase
MKKRVGIFGGTFNPPHIGHVEAAKAFLKGAMLDELIIMPAFIPPHKEYTSTVTCSERLDMCRLAFTNVQNATVSDLEISRGGKSFTYLTLEALKNDSNELYFLCGTDMILTMDTWKNPDIIFSLANICYIRRESDESTTDMIDEKCKEYSRVYNAKIIPINARVIEISSSDIRNKKVSADEYLSPEVLEYIRKAGLYE